MTPLMVDVLLVTLPMVAVAAITWCLVWPRWKLVVKILLHPCLYAALSVYVGHWSVLLAWLHQGLFGLGGHIWFCSKHGLHLVRRGRSPMLRTDFEKGGAIPG